ncbi:MAG: GNAT family N-acetyltransferase [Anaerolineales bacterium]|nr:GNAT family N-acetyltransferase [Anaerolineales bacterium]
MDTLLMTNTMIQPLEIPGLVLRGFRGEEDYPKMLAVINGCKEVDGIERSDTVEDIARSYAHLHNCDPYQDLCFAEVDGQVIGYTRVWWDFNGEGQWEGFKFANVLPEWRRKGVGAALLKFNEGRLREIAAHLRQEGQIPVGMPMIYTSFVDDSAKDTGSFLLANGYCAVRYSYEMVRPDLENIPSAPLPTGLEVRPVLPEHYRLIWEASNEAFRDHWGYVFEPWDEWLEWMEGPLFDPSLWRVAWDGDRVAGMVLSFIDAAQNKEYGRLRGYTENICVRRPWRKRGLAFALIAQSLLALKQRGMTEAALGVDAENISGALRLYQSAGFEVVKRQTIFHKEFSLED